MTHTPGPWIWGDNYHGLYGAGPDNEILTYADYEGMWVSHGAARKANASLIAAAPELLEALQYSIAAFDDDAIDEIEADYGLGTARRIDVARKAIAKATRT